ncbi:MAG: hypothetical protein E7504_07505 [Ruminococcus sp.]|nr:hypothetical protein [Ruminococcus sp.]
MTIENEKDLGTAIKNGEQCIEIEGDLGKKVVRIKATGKVAWAVAIGGLTVAVAAIIMMIPTGPLPAPAAIAGILPAAAVLGGTGVSGVAVAFSAALIAAGGGGVGTLNKLRAYKMEKQGDKVILRKK